MEKLKRGLNYILVSDGGNRIEVCNIPLFCAREAIRQAREAMEGVTPQRYLGPLRPPKKERYVLVGSSEATIIWRSITREQAEDYFKWVLGDLSDFRRNAATTCAPGASSASKINEVMEGAGR